MYVIAVTTYLPWYTCSRRNERVESEEGAGTQRIGAAAENLGCRRLSEPSHDLVGVQVSKTNDAGCLVPIHFHTEGRLEYIDGEHGPWTSLEPHRG